MRASNASVESPAAPQSSRFLLPDAELIAAAWADLPPADGLPARPDKAKTVSGAMLALGVALLLFVPLGGALFVVAGGLGLAIASEPPMGTTAIQPQPSSSTNQ